MHHDYDAGRRRFLKQASSLAAAGLALPALSACAPAALDRGLVFSNLDEGLRELERLTLAPALRSSAGWSWPQTLIHCAQSIEFSLHGFPEAKPALFQATVGAAAFRVFSWRQRMAHNLEESIPGAPLIAADAAVDDARQRLLTAVSDFRRSTGPLQPHFAYGALSKAEYERAHAMHLADHFSAFDVAA